MVVTKPVALITGASAGIGAVFARALAARGYDLILVARRRGRLEALAAELGPSAEILEADLADSAQLKLVEARASAEPRLELLVNNAGFGVSGRFWETDVEMQTRLHLLHILAVMRLTHAALGPMTARNRGALLTWRRCAVSCTVLAALNTTPASPGSRVSPKAWIWNRRTRIGRVQARPGYTHSEFHDVAGIDPETIPPRYGPRRRRGRADPFDGMEREKAIRDPGWRYQFVALLRVLPSSWVRAGSLGHP